MKHKILAFATLLMAAFAFTACDDGEDVKEFTEANVTNKTVTVTASLPSATGFGMITEFSANDMLRIVYLKADGTQTGRTQTLRYASGSGSSATFSAAGIAVPNDAATLLAYWDTPTSTINYGSKPTIDNLGDQDGTEDFIKKHTCLAGTTSVGDEGTVALAYKTAVLKLVVEFPEDADTPTLSNTTITLKAKDGAKGYYNKVNISCGQPLEDGSLTASEYGDIVVKPTSIDAAAKTATAYAVVWPKAADNTDVDLTAMIDNAAFLGNFTPSATIQTGKINTVNSTVDFTTREYDLWMSDDAQTISDVSGKVVDAPKWMSLSNGVISIQANTSGSSRKGTMTLDNGRKYTITQIGPDDFKGNWTFYAKRFNASKTAGGNNNTAKVNVTFGEPLKAETLPDTDGTLYTNNIGVRGLYLNTVMSGTVAIDYDAHTVKVGFFLDSREAQPTGNATYPYAVYLPEGAGVNTWGNYTFSPLDYSATYYAWLWFDLSEDMSTLRYVYYGTTQKIGKYYPCGISIATATSTDRSTIKGGSSYDCIYQANYNGSNSEGIYFQKN